SVLAEGWVLLGFLEAVDRAALVAADYSWQDAYQAGCHEQRVAFQAAQSQAERGPRQSAQGVEPLARQDHVHDRWIGQGAEDGSCETDPGPPCGDTGEPQGKEGKPEGARKAARHPVDRKPVMQDEEE